MISTIALAYREKGVGSKLIYYQQQNSSNKHMKTPPQRLPYITHHKILKRKWTEIREGTAVAASISLSNNIQPTISHQKLSKQIPTFLLSFSLSAFFFFFKYISL